MMFGSVGKQEIHGILRKVQVVHPPVRVLRFLQDSFHLPLDLKHGDRLSPLQRFAALRVCVRLLEEYRVAEQWRCRGQWIKSVRFVAMWKMQPSCFITSKVPTEKTRQ